MTQDSQAAVETIATNFVADPMLALTLYCKSYRQDLLRLERLARSVQQFNTDSIPFYVSVPEQDFTLFKEKLVGLDVNLIMDESILQANNRLNFGKVMELPGGLSQQIIKSEFWRLKISVTYVCLDSDCVFIRPFFTDDFISPDGYPYTVMHEAKELLQFSINHGQNKVFDSYHSLRAELAHIVGRKGRHYDFGPVPFIWDSRVWSDLDTLFLQPRNLNFHDAIMQLPSELLWYGEALLKFRPFPIMPVEPLFRVYHNEVQYFFQMRHGENIEHLSKNYLGVCFQSNWQKEFDLKKKPLLSRIARWIRRQFAKLR